MSSIVCFGEILWDKFPEDRIVGGAPLNVAVRLKELDNEIAIISRIGADADGRAIFEMLRERGINTNGIQVDDVLKTGIVDVILDAKGSATYDIMFPRAWDNIQVSENAKKLIRSSNAFVFGSLATRNQTSRETLFDLLEISNFNVFDVNLRKPYYKKDVLINLMNKADFIKFNDDEIFEISSMLGCDTLDLEQAIQLIAEKTETSTICVTKGQHGAVLYIDGQFYHNCGYHVKVVDTVGAGDSFLAGLINKLIRKDKPQEMLDFACAVGAIVASKSGANPIISYQEIEQIMFAKSLIY